MRQAAPAPGGLGSIFTVFPLILIPVITYNLWAFAASAGHETAQEISAHFLTQLQNFEHPLLNVPMASGSHWVMTAGDGLVLISILLLFIEMLKSTSTGSAAIFNHALSMLVFIICLVEFLLHPAFSTSVFFVIMIISLLDVLAGVVVTIISARRDVEFAGQ